MWYFIVRPGQSLRSHERRVMYASTHLSGEVHPHRKRQPVPAGASDRCCPPPVRYAQKGWSDLREARLAYRGLKSKIVRKCLIVDRILMPEHRNVKGRIDEFEPIKIALPHRCRIKHTEPFLA